PSTAARCRSRDRAWTWTPMFAGLGGCAWSGPVEVSRGQPLRAAGAASGGAFVYPRRPASAGPIERRWCAPRHEFVRRTVFRHGDVPELLPELHGGWSGGGGVSGGVGLTTARFAAGR